jgi:hypothetical protein
LQVDQVDRQAGRKKRPSAEQRNSISPMAYDQRADNYSPQAGIRLPPADKSIANPTFGGGDPERRPFALNQFRTKWLCGSTHPVEDPLELLALRLSELELLGEVENVLRARVAV